MIDANQLSEWVPAFQRDGFVVAKQLFDEDEIAAVLRYAKSDAALGADAYTRNDASGAKSKLALWNDLADDSLYAAIVRSNRVVGTMEHLLGHEVYHYHHKMMLKEPRVGGAWEWHQDYGYWYNFGCLYPDMGSCLLAVDLATRENGCLQVLRGSHKLGRIDHGTTGEQMGADQVRVDEARRRHELVHCELSPGDALFFHGNLLHCSSRNESEYARWSLICCYNTRHNDPFITGGRHPNYSPLERWSDEKVRNLLLDADANCSSPQSTQTTEGAS
jgi:ectoine hydroxylase-related dioxygenase (phytanoyl-CoA dioxygenase family)